MVNFGEEKGEDENYVATAACYPLRSWRELFFSRSGRKEFTRRSQHIVAIIYL
jgi:hypothetical protein